MIQQAPAGEGGGVGSLCRTWLSTQAGWEVDVDGVRAPRAVNPCRLGQQPHPARGPGGGLWQQRSAEGPSPQQESAAAAGRLQMPMLAGWQVTARHH